MDPTGRLDLPGPGSTPSAIIAAFLTQMGLCCKFGVLRGCAAPRSEIQPTLLSFVGLEADFSAPVSGFQSKGWVFGDYY